MITDTPDPDYGSMTCPVCGTSAQVLVQTTDSMSGNPMFNADRSASVMNDNTASTQEMDEHIATAHPS